MISTFDLEKLGGLLKDFYEITKIRITIFDDAYREIISYPRQIAPICRFIRENEAAEKACRACDRKACETAAARRTTYVYQCHAGLTEAVAPVYAGSLLVAYLLFGHPFSYPSQWAGWEAVRDACRPYGLDEERLKDHLLQLPLTPREHIVSASHILQAVASYLCMDRLITLHEQETLVQLDEYISHHFTEELDVTFLCDRFQVGKTRLYEFARQNYGCGIAEHIRALRIEYACRLLKEDPGLTITEVAEKCGFRDYNYFITVFRRETGTTPKRFRG